MRLRTFNAPDMPSAMQMVREALGDDAIILSTQEVVNGKRYVTVKAAVENEPLADDIPAPLHRSITPSPLPAFDLATDQLRRELHNILRFHNIPELFIARLMQKLTPEMLTQAIGLHKVSRNESTHQLQRVIMASLLDHSFTYAPLAMGGGKPSRLMLVGTPGIGKTLTVAKIASKMTVSNMPVVVITTDNKRAGGIEQLRAFTDILGLDLKVADDTGALDTCLRNIPSFAHVIIDTAGCNPYSAGEMKHLSALCKHDTIDPVLVMPAGGDSLEAIDMVELFTTLPLKRLLITQADSSRRLGSIIAACMAGNLSFSNVSMSSSVVDALHPANGTLLAELLLRYQQPSP